MSEAERRTIVAEVTAATRAFEEAEKALDVGSLLVHLSTDFYMYQDGQRVEYPAIVEQIQTTLPTLQRFDTEFRDVQVHVLGPRGALVSLEFRDAVTDATGATTRQRGATTFGWRREGDAWRMVYAHADHYPLED